MKRVLTFLLGVYSITVFGQNQATVNQQANLNSALGIHNASSPNVASFQKVSHIPMNNYTGRANVTIPLYEISSGDLTIPISISYNTSGVKIADIPSSVGSNWSLNAGGSISKTVKGLEDFYYKAERSHINERFTTKSLGWAHLNDFQSHHSLNSLLGGTAPFSIPANSSGGIQSNPWGLVTDKGDDSRPDLFTAHAPGLSTSFIHKKDKTPMEINHQGNTIISSFGESEPISLFGFLDGWESRRRIKCINNIKIINTQGIQYNFGDVDVSQSADLMARQKYLRTQKLDLYSYNQVDTYHLSSVKSNTTGKEILFKYIPYSLSDDPGNLVSFYDLSGNNINQAPGIYHEQFMKRKYPQLNRLDKIVFDMGSVEFIHAESRNDLIGDQALTFIRVKDLHNQVIKTFKFEYGYFISDTNCNDPKCKRLKLTKIRIFNKTGQELPGYEFTYNEKRLPERDTFNQDFLGYANAPTSSLTGGAPELYFSVNKGNLSLFPISLGSEYRKLSGVYSMVPNLEYAQRGSLTKIKYPTGGTTEFQYELNSFLINGKEINGGGLRLKSQNINDLNGNTQILDYSYITTNSKTSGRLNAIPLFGRVQLGPYGEYTGNLNTLVFYIYQSSLSQAELTDGAYVGYSRVLVKNRGTNGYTEYNYTSSEDYPDTTAPVHQTNYDGSSSTTITSYQARFFKQNGGFGDLPIDNGLFRGRLKKESIYKASGDLIYQKEIEYTAKTYTSTPIQYFREERDIVIPESNGATLSNEYIQRINIQSQRYLPTKNTTTEHFEGGRNIKNVITNTYSSKFPFITEEKSSNSTGKEIRTKISYLEKIPKVVLSEEKEMLLSQNRFNIPLEKKSYLNNDVITNEFFHYKNWGNGIVAPEYIKTAIGTTNGNNLPRNSIQYHKYDTSNGKPSEVSQLNGVHSIFIWGYKGEYLIAKIDNATYSGMPTNIINLINQIKTTSNTEKTDAEENTLRSLITSLRSNPYFKDSFFTTYTYDPLIGITSVTDPNGYIMHYEYDEFHRLKFVKDTEGKLISENKYQYKNQQ